MIQYELSVIQSKDTKDAYVNTKHAKNRQPSSPKTQRWQKLRPLNIVCNTRLLVHVCYLLVMLVLGTRLHCGYGVWSGVLKRAENQLCFQAFKHYETTIKDTTKLSLAEHIDLYWSWKYCYKKKIRQSNLILIRFRMNKKHSPVYVYTRFTFTIHDMC